MKEGNVNDRTFKWIIGGGLVLGLVYTLAIIGALVALILWLT